MQPVRPQDLIETFPIEFADGRKFHGELYRTARNGGRRVQVREKAFSPILFDTDDCYDVANVRAKLEEWIARREKNKESQQ